LLREPFASLGSAVRAESGPALAESGSANAQASSASKLSPETPDLWSVEYIDSGSDPGVDSGVGPGKEPHFVVNVVIPLSSFDFRGSYYGSGTAVLEIQYDPGDKVWRDAQPFDLWDWDGPIVVSAISLAQPAGESNPYSSFRVRMTHSFYDSQGKHQSACSPWSDTVTAQDG
jgi:hypothetical protein